MENDEIIITLNLNMGEEHATAWGCDLSYDYVKINAEYTT
jgi:glutamate N-acetyltransferase/amino-acid N-acetyltransferase